MAILDLNNTQDIYNRTPKRDFTQAYNEMLQANQVLNNPNLGGASFTPKKSLVDIHNEAMAKNTPAWAMALSNAMPSIGEIVANATIKNGFQQRPVAESLERQKQRQQAYNQWLQENEQNQAKDFVQIAKEQLGMDIAEDERNWNRNQADKMFDYRTARDKVNDDIAKKNLALAYNKYLDDNDRWAKEFDLKQGVTNAQLKKLGIETNNLLNPNKELTTKDLIDLENLKKIQRENSPEYIEKQEKEKKEQEENKAVISKADKLLEKKAITPEQYAEMVSNPQKYKDVPLENRNWFTRFWRKVPFTDTNTLRFGTNNDYEIMQDANGNRAKVYKDGRIEEL